MDESQKSLSIVSTIVLPVAVVVVGALFFSEVESLGIQVALALLVISMAVLATGTIVTYKRNKRQED